MAFAKGSAFAQRLCPDKVWYFRLGYEASLMSLANGSSFSWRGAPRFGIFSLSNERFANGETVALFSFADGLLVLGR